MIVDLRKLFKYIHLLNLKSGEVKLYLTNNILNKPHLNKDIDFSFYKKALAIDDTLLHEIDNGSLISYKFGFQENSLCINELKFARHLNPYEKIKSVSNIVDSLRKRFYVQLIGGHESNHRILVDFMEMEHASYRKRMSITNVDGYINFNIYEKFEETLNKMFYDVIKYRSTDERNTIYLSKNENNKNILAYYRTTYKDLAILEKATDKIQDFLLNDDEACKILRDKIVKKYFFNVSSAYIYRFDIHNAELRRM